jgi:hypothetical protein
MLLALFFLGLSLDQRHVLDVGRDVFGFIACGLAFAGAVNMAINWVEERENKNAVADKNTTSGEVR